MALPPEARAGLMRAWLAILRERHPHLVWIDQRVALETWVTYAVDLLKRGESIEAVLAKLTQEGCPDPERVVAKLA